MCGFLCVGWSVRLVYLVRVCLAICRVDALKWCVWGWGVGV